MFKFGKERLFEEKLKQVIHEMALYGEEANGGAGKRELAKFKEKVVDELNIDLPQEYIKLLKVINGLEFNGFIIYGIDEELLEKTPKQNINGFIELNKTWYENEWQKQYVFLGESSIGWYVYDGTEQKYYELDNPSGTVSEEFPNLELMVEKVLTDALM